MRQRLENEIMRNRFIVLLAVLGLLGGCASLGLNTSCDGRDWPRPSYFDQGQHLAAFKTVLQARSEVLEGILQIKQIASDTYDAVLFAAAGGYKLMQAQVTPQGAEFLFLTEVADRALVREKAASFLTLLLFPPSSYQTCREQETARVVTCGSSPAAHYMYLPNQRYPASASIRKTFGTVHMSFEEYRPYGQAMIPYKISYKDGALQADLLLIALKTE